MNIVVLVKQIPTPSEIRFDPEKKTIVREGVSLMVNSLDRRAVTQAVRLREQVGGSVTAVTMGPPSARDALFEALAAGADRAVHLCDRAFAGADTLATARALAAAIRKLGPVDLVLCGRFSLDAETGQVGPELAELLGLPQATNLAKLTLDAAAGTARVRRELEDGFEDLDVDLPALLSAGEFLVRPFRPKPEQIAAARETRAADVVTWTAADLGDSADQFGVAGSPTSVAEIRQLVTTREQTVVQGDDPLAAAKQIYGFLMRRGYGTPWQRPGRPALPPRRAASNGRDVWVVAEPAEGRLRPVTVELLGKAAELATATGGEAVAVLLGHQVGDQAGTLIAHGADRVLLADDPALARYLTSAYADVLSAAIQARRPYAVLFGATVNGRELAPRIAARLQLGLTGDAIDLAVEDGRLVQLKPAFGGAIVAPIFSRTLPNLATVRPGIFPKPEPDPSRSVVVEQLPVGAAGDGRVRFVGAEPIAGGFETDLDGAEIVVGVGTGIGSVEHLPMVKELARALGGAAIGATQHAVSEGLLPAPIQIGLTGRAIAPRFYIALGIRGALYHMVGLHGAETIIAVNNDPAAEIFKVADFGVVGDLHQVVPRLIELFDA